MNRLLFGDNLRWLQDTKLFPDACVDQNLFSILGKYVQRQNENLLTQSLAAIFNHCPIFRNDLLDLFRRRSEDRSFVASGGCLAITQNSQLLKKGRILVDMEIRCGINCTPQYVVEAKLTAPLSAKQATNYSECLKRRRGKSRLVLLTMVGIDSELKKLLPQNTLWLTWTEIAELAVRPAYRPKTERFLCRQFYEMLKEKGIPMVPSISSTEYEKLALLNRFVESKGTRDLTVNTIGMLHNVMARLRIFADASWNSLTNEGYGSFGRLFAFRPSRNNGVWPPYADIEVGFYRWKKRHHVHERNLFLGIECDSMRLYVYEGWALGRKHPKYDSDDWGEYLKKWTLRQSRRLFNLPLHDAYKEIQTDLEKCLRQFKNSRYYRA